MVNVRLRGSSSLTRPTPCNERYKGFSGMQRWVGLGIIADNLINIGRAIERSAPTRS